MRIAIDGRSVYQEASLRGVGKTLLDLYRNLARQRPYWTFDMYYQAWNGKDPFAGFTNVKRRQVDGKGDRFHAWQHLWFPLAAGLSGADVLHCHGAIAPRFSATRMVTTIHDLTPIEFQPHDSEVKAWAANVGRGARRARRVVACSEHTRHEVNRVFGVPLRKITTVYWGPNEEFSKPIESATIAAIRARYGIVAERPYALHFGMSKLRKNTRRLLQAWAQLPQDIRSSSALLIVGIEPHALGEFQRRVQELDIGASCRVHGYVPEEDLPPLLRGASVLCYLSLSEGFGLPILDAFASDTAVLCSNNTSLPEVAGNAGLLVSPTDTTAIANGIARLFKDDSTRDELVSRGRIQLARFSWQRCAEQMADILAAA